MKLADMQALLTLALNGRSTQPSDIGAKCFFFFRRYTQVTYHYFLAYYIHTSGSTGKPKCVVHCHGSLDWHSHMTLLGSGLTRVDDTCLQVADCSFDLHIRDIFCFLSTGANIVTIPQGIRTIQSFFAPWIDISCSCPF
jgi:non-ribosomal peptide synthetase component F